MGGDGILQQDGGLDMGGCQRAPEQEFLAAAGLLVAVVGEILETACGG